MVMMTSSSDATNAPAAQGILNTLESGSLYDYWRPATQNEFQFIQAEFWAIMKVTGVTVKTQSEVTTFLLFYEDLTELFVSYDDPDTNEPKVFHVYQGSSY